MRHGILWVMLVSLFFSTGCPRGGDDGPSRDADVADATDVGDQFDLSYDVRDGGVQDTTVDGGDGEALEIEGLSASVEVFVDRWGIPHFRCQTDTDCAAALGYFHARDRFVQMDIGRRVARGQIGTLVPLPQLADFDATNRALTMTTDGEWMEDAMWTAMDDETKALGEAYSAGVNAWLDDLRNGENDARLSEEYEHPLIHADEIRDWELRDSLAMWAFAKITARYNLQIRYGEIFSILDPLVAIDLMGPATVTPLNAYEASGVSFPMLLDGRGTPREPTVQHLRQARPLLAAASEHATLLEQFLGASTSAGGSNAWAVGPSLSSSGHALMAQDGHNQLTNPAPTYLAEIDAVSAGEGTLHAGGYSPPGAPIFVGGWNEHVAWGGTTAYFDHTDIYVETLSASGEGVMYQGTEVPFETREFETGNTTRTLRWVPHHGPVLELDTDAGTALTHRTTARDAAALVGDIEMMKEWMRVTTLDEFRGASEHGGPHNATMAVMDTSDNFGLVSIGRVPTRPWASLDDLYPALPLPGDGSAEWGGLVPNDDLPAIVNPASGLVATSNQPLTNSHVDGDPTNDDGPLLQSQTAQTFRHQRVVDLLTSQAQHSFETFRAMHGDAYSLAAEMTLPEILATAETLTLSAEAMEVVDRLAEWDYTCPRGLDGIDPDAPKVTDTSVVEASIACTVFHTLLFVLIERAIGDELAPAEVRVERGSLRPLRDIVFLLNEPSRFANGEAYWDDVDTADTTESRADVILSSLEATPGDLNVRFGQAWDDRRWGMHVQLVRQAPLFMEFTPQFNDGPYPLAGAFEGIQGHRARAWTNSRPNHDIHRGPKTRLVVVNTDDGLRARLQLPGGQVHRRDSEHYDDLLRAYLANEYVDFAFGPDAYEAAATRTLVIEPAGERQ